MAIAVDMGRKATKTNKQTDLSLSGKGYLNGPHLYLEIRREIWYHEAGSRRSNSYGKIKNMCGSVYTLKKIMVGR